MAGTIAAAPIRADHLPNKGGAARAAHMTTAEATESIAAASAEAANAAAVASPDAQRGTTEIPTAMASASTTAVRHRGAGQRGAGERGGDDNGSEPLH